MPKIMINDLECFQSPPKTPASPLAMFLHPHPLRGGTMNNRVVVAAYKAFLAYGAGCLRFNFRGVGQSVGKFSKGEGELPDAQSLLDWMQLRHTHNAQNWIIGFSFGAWIALELLSRRREISNFIAIAPPVNLYEFPLSSFKGSGLVIQGTHDNLVPLSAIQNMVDTMNSNKGCSVELKTIQTDHVFSTGLPELYSTIHEYLQRNISTTESPLVF